MPASWKNWFSFQQLPKALPTEKENAEKIETLKQQVPVPTIWLFGKTGSGKSTVIRHLTGAEGASVGSGFRPHTKTSRLFDFPDAEQPLLKFLDTRGLGEVGYDPSEDINAFGKSSQLMLATVRVTDHALDEMLAHLRTIRAAAKDRPLILIVTCLHQAPASLDISAIKPDPFKDPFESIPDSQSMDPQHAKPSALDFTMPIEGISSELNLLLAEKQKQFVSLADHIVPIDITPASEGFADPEFGGKRLRSAILHYMPQAYRQALLALHDITSGARSERQRKSQRQVLASSAMAASAGAIPLPYVDIPAVLGIQTHLAYRIAEIYEQRLTAAHWAILSSVVGSRVAIPLLLRQLLKLIPAVGMAANAASAFVFTYALGMAWDWYFSQVRLGEVPSSDQLKEVFWEQTQRGRKLWEMDQP